MFYKADPAEVIQPVHLAFQEVPEIRGGELVPEIFTGQRITAVRLFLLQGLDHPAGDRIRDLPVGRGQLSGDRPDRYGQEQREQNLRH